MQVLIRWTAIIIVFLITGNHVAKLSTRGKYCGNNLTNILSFICLAYNSPPKDSNEWETYSGGAYNTCCKDSCNLEDLMSYCSLINSTAVSVIKSSLGGPYKHEKKIKEQANERKMKRTRINVEPNDEKLKILNQKSLGCKCCEKTNTKNGNIQSIWKLFHRFSKTSTSTDKGKFKCNCSCKQKREKEASLRNHIYRRAQIGISSDTNKSLYIWRLNVR